MQRVQQLDKSQVALSGSPQRHVGVRLPAISNGIEMQELSRTEFALNTKPNDVPESPQVKPEEAPPKPSCCSAFIAYINTEEYWPLWVGLIWYAIVIGYTFWGLEMPKFIPWTETADLNKTFSMVNFSSLLLIMTGIAITMTVVHQSLGKPYGAIQYMLLLSTVFVCGIIGSNTLLKSSGMGTSIWCIFFGIALRLIFYTVYTDIKSKIYDLEFFIKAGIVLLAINLKGIGVVGAKALMVSWVQTLLILPLVYAIGVYIMKMPKDQALVTSSTVCICGTSAGMTIGECVSIDKDALTSIIAATSILTVPLIPTMPLAKSVNDIVLGAWIGGSVDSSGAVIATASLRSPSATQVAVIIKMLQNIIIGVVALFVTFIWHKTCNAKILWTKFPKFVLGFIIVAIITTVMPENMVDRLVANSFFISEWYSWLSFVIIGFEIDLLKLWARIKTHKLILLLYIVGQLIDLGTTFGMAYLFMSVVQ